MIALHLENTLIETIKLPSNKFILGNVIVKGNSNLDDTTLFALRSAHIDNTGTTAIQEYRLDCEILQSLIKVEDIFANCKGIRPIGFHSKNMEINSTLSQSALDEFLKDKATMSTGLSIKDNKVLRYLNLSSFTQLGQPQAIGLELVNTKIEKIHLPAGQFILGHVTVRGNKHLTEDTLNGLRSAHGSNTGNVNVQREGECVVRDKFTEMDGCKGVYETFELTNQMWRETPIPDSFRPQWIEACVQVDKFVTLPSDFFDGIIRQTYTSNITCPGYMKACVTEELFNNLNSVLNNKLGTYDNNTQRGACEKMCTFFLLETSPNCTVVHGLVSIGPGLTEAVKAKLEKVEAIKGPLVINATTLTSLSFLKNLRQVDSSKDDDVPAITITGNKELADFGLNLTSVNGMGETLIVIKDNKKGAKMTKEVHEMLRNLTRGSLETDAAPLVQQIIPSTTSIPAIETTTPEDHLPLIIGLSVGIPVALLIIAAVIVTVVVLLKRLCKMEVKKPFVIEVLSTSDPFDNLETSCPNYIPDYSKLIRTIRLTRSILQIAPLRLRQALMNGLPWLEAIGNGKWENTRRYYTEYHVLSEDFKKAREEYKVKMILKENDKKENAAILQKLFESGENSTVVLAGFDQEDLATLLKGYPEFFKVIKVEPLKAEFGMGHPSAGVTTTKISLKIKETDKVVNVEYHNLDVPATETTFFGALNDYLKHVSIARLVRWAKTFNVPFVCFSAEKAVVAQMFYVTYAYIYDDERNMAFVKDEEWHPFITIIRVSLETLGLCRIYPTECMSVYAMQFLNYIAFYVSSRFHHNKDVVGQIRCRTYKNRNIGTYRGEPLPEEEVFTEITNYFAETFRINRVAYKHRIAGTEINWNLELPQASQHVKGTLEERFSQGAGDLKVATDFVMEDTTKKIDLFQ